MKWYKHSTDMKCDPILNVIIDKHGLLGNTIYRDVIEDVAANLSTNNPEPVCQLTTEYFAVRYNVDIGSVREVIDLMACLRVIDKDMWSNDNVIYMSKVVAWADEYYKKAERRRVQGNPEISEHIRSVRSPSISYSSNINNASNNINKDIESVRSVRTHEKTDTQIAREEFESITQSNNKPYFTWYRDSMDALKDVIDMSKQESEHSDKDWLDIFKLAVNQLSQDDWYRKKNMVDPIRLKKAFTRFCRPIEKSQLQQIDTEKDPVYNVEDLK